MEQTAVKRAEAIPQPAGAKRPAGSVLYLCNGLNEFQQTCGRMLFVWIPEGNMRSGHGQIEIKCRACKTLNLVPLKADRS